MLTVNGFCCTVYDPRSSQGQEIPQHGKIVHPHARLADAWGALEEFDGLDTRYIPDQSFFRIALSRAGKPGSHPTDPEFQPRPAEDLTKDAKVFLYMNGKLISAPLNVDRLPPQFENFPSDPNAGAKYLDYDKTVQLYGSDMPEVELDAIFLNAEENCRRQEEGLCKLKLEAAKISKELRDEHFFVEVVVVPADVTAIPTPKAGLYAITAFKHLAHFRFIFVKTNMKLIEYDYIKTPSFVHESTILDSWPSISRRSRS